MKPLVKLRDTDGRKMFAGKVNRVVVFPKHRVSVQQEENTLQI